MDASQTVEAVGALPVEKQPGLVVRMWRSVTNLVRSMFLDEQGTWSLGRIGAFLFGAWAFGISFWFMVLITYVVFTDRMETAALLASALAPIFVAAVGSPLLASLGSYLITKKLTGGATADQVMAPQIVEEAGPGGI